MRLLPVLLALPLFALQAHAQTVLPEQSAAAPVVAGPPAQAPNMLVPSAPAHHRMTWQQRFSQANLAHDGHLTMQEASGGYPSIAHHFTEIDADKKGYVTETDVANWHKLQRAMRHPAQGQIDGGMRPHPAFQRGLTGGQPVNASTNGGLPPTPAPDAPPATTQ